MQDTKPTITGWLVIDLSQHIDSHGFVTNEGENLAWGLMARAPEGVNVRLRIGDLKALISGRLIYGLTEGGIFKARRIEVEGSNPDGVKAILTALTGLREMAA